MRLSLALDEGLSLGGPVAVHLPHADTDLTGLDDPQVHSPDWGVCRHFAARCLPVNVDRRAASALVIAPRAKALARDVIARAVAVPGVVAVDGQKTDGVDSLWKACRARAEVLGTITKAHGRLFWMRAEAGAFDDWVWAQPDVHGFTLAPGVFSADGIDPGSLALAECLPAALPGRVLDLGAGWGYPSAVAQARGADHVDLVEADRSALDCARANVDAERAAFHWHDATLWGPRAPVDHVVMNPPFHTGRAGTPALGQAFIAAAARALSPRGDLWMVANRHLPYEETLARHFARVEPVPGPPGSEGFKVVHATRPRR
ncbi:MAG: class I SAM-dependent methyltransferase [Shimia sp.]